MLGETHGRHFGRMRSAQSSKRKIYFNSLLLQLHFQLQTQQKVQPKIRFGPNLRFLIGFQIWGATLWKITEGVSKKSTAPKLGEHSSENLLEILKAVLNWSVDLAAKIEFGKSVSSVGFLLF